MANKVKNIRALSAETAREITQSPENWMKFLDTASRVYKYPFHEQMLIYAQRPDAIACASIEVWNKKLPVRPLRSGTKICAGGSTVAPKVSPCWTIPAAISN